MTLAPKDEGMSACLIRTRSIGWSEKGNHQACWRRLVVWNTQLARSSYGHGIPPPVSQWTRGH